VLAEDHLLQIRIQLQDVDGAYHQIKDDRVVFIVSGRAVNTSAEPLRACRSRARSTTARPGDRDEEHLHGQRDVAEDRQGPLEQGDLFAAAARAAEAVRDPSGESAGFSVVFLSRRRRQEFTARVVAAQSSAS